MQLKFHKTIKTGRAFLCQNGTKYIIAKLIIIFMQQIEILIFIHSQCTSITHCKQIFSISKILLHLWEGLSDGEWARLLTTNIASFLFLSRPHARDYWKTKSKNGVKWIDIYNILQINERTIINKWNTHRHGGAGTNSLTVEHIEEGQYPITTIWTS